MKIKIQHRITLKVKVDSFSTLIGVGGAFKLEPGGHFGYSHAIIYQFIVAYTAPRLTPIQSTTHVAEPL